MSQLVSAGLSWSRLVSASLLFLFQMATRLPPDQAAIFLSLMTMEEQSFTPGDVLEAVQLNRDFPSALKFLTHSCPICQEQVSFSNVRDTSSESRQPHSPFSLSVFPVDHHYVSSSLFVFHIDQHHVCSSLSVFPVDHHHDSLLLFPVSDLF